MKRLFTVLVTLCAALSVHAQGNDTKALQFEDLYSPNSVAKETTITPGDVERFQGRLLHTNTNTYLSDPGVRRGYSLQVGPTRSGGLGLALNF